MTVPDRAMQVIGEVRRERFQVLETKAGEGLLRLLGPGRLSLGSIAPDYPEA